MKNFKKDWLKNKYMVIDYSCARIKKIYKNQFSSTKKLRNYIIGDLNNYLQKDLNLKKEDFKDITSYITNYNEEAKTYGTSYENEYIIDFILDINEKLNLLEKSYKENRNQMQ